MSYLSLLRLNIKYVWPFASSQHFSIYKRTHLSNTDVMRHNPKKWKSNLKNCCHCATFRDICGQKHMHSVSVFWDVSRPGCYSGQSRLNVIIICPSERPVMSQALAGVWCGLFRALRKHKEENPIEIKKEIRKYHCMGSYVSVWMCYKCTTKMMPVKDFII